MINYICTQKARQLSISYKQTLLILQNNNIMKTLLHPSTQQQVQDRNAVLFVLVCLAMITFVCIYSPNVFQA